MNRRAFVRNSLLTFGTSLLARADGQRSVMFSANSGSGADVAQESPIPARPAGARALAPAPPMGWNSFDAYDSAINEEQFRTIVDYMARNLLEYGWQYAVIDYLWFHPAPGKWRPPNRRLGHADLRLDTSGRPIDKLTMDRHGRLLPAVERFPSADGGRGFKPLADYVHGRGLKFGIHIMRGIPRQAYFDNLPILGAAHGAKDIGEPWDTCSWLNHMFGIDPTRPGAQEYYSSIFRMYAEWGVDFVKVDDILQPVYSKGELELIRNAVNESGRPMVLSLSPGEAPLSQARQVERIAEMWRISADFWDEWPALEHNFDLLNAWSSYIGPDSWPDADMLPIGHISLGARPHGPDRMSKFTWPEHYTLMSLWCIARSPLFVGADLPTSSERSLSFLKNKEVLAVNQRSENNRQVFKRDGHAAWMADIPGSKDKYLALFNLKNQEEKVRFIFEHEMLRGKFLVRDLWAQKDVGVHEKEFGLDLEPHGAGLFRLTPAASPNSSRR